MFNKRFFSISQGIVSLSVIRTLVSVILSLAQVVHSPIFIFLQSSLIQRERQTDSWSVSQPVRASADQSLVRLAQAVRFSVFTFLLPGRRRGKESLEVSDRIN